MLHHHESAPREADSEARELLAAGSLPVTNPFSVLADHPAAPVSANRFEAQPGMPTLCETGWIEHSPMTNDGINITLVQMSHLRFLPPWPRTQNFRLVGPKSCQKWTSRQPPAPHTYCAEAANLGDLPHDFEATLGEADTEMHERHTPDTSDTSLPIINPFAAMAGTTFLGAVEPHSGVMEASGLPGLASMPDSCPLAQLRVGMNAVASPRACISRTRSFLRCAAKPSRLCCCSAYRRPPPYSTDAQLEETVPEEPETFHVAAAPPKLSDSADHDQLPASNPFAAADVLTASASSSVASNSGMLFHRVPARSCMDALLASEVQVRRQASDGESARMHHIAQGAPQVPAQPFRMCCC